MKSLIDLHMHSTYSDGTLAPEKLIKRCAKKHVNAVALTDHDTVAGLAEGKEAAEALDMEFINGIELSVAFEPGSLHILGYFFDAEHKPFLKAIREIQASRNERNPKIVKALQKLGFKIEYDEIAAVAGEGGQIGRPHIAQVLLDKGYVKTRDKAFEKFLAKGQPAFVDKWRLTSKEAIRMIKEAGGIASVAHPFSLGLDEVELEKAISRMAAEGLDALEIFHSSHKPRHRNDLLHIAKKFDLLATGGSDYHGYKKSNVDVGYLGRSGRFEEGDLLALKARVGEKN